MEALYEGGTPGLQAWLLLLLGLVFCFGGYGLYRSFPRVYGMLLGFLIGTLAGAFTRNATVAVTGAAAGAVLGALLLPTLYFTGLFLTGGLAGALLAALPVLALETGSRFPEFGAAIFGFLVGGILGVWYEKTSMVLLTAIYGVAIAGFGLNALGVPELVLGPRGRGPHSVFAWSATALAVRAGLLIFGIAIQTVTVRRMERQRHITQYW